MKRQYAVSAVTCDVCGQTTRYRHRRAECDQCGKTYCRQRSNGRYCSDQCRNAAAVDAAEPSNLRAERDEARRIAIVAWQQLGDPPDDAPFWLRRGLSPEVA